MKRIVMVVLCLTIFASPALAERRYIKYHIDTITFRSGPGTEYKILKKIEVGRPVELLKVEGDWSMVKTSDGEEGYVLSQFLSSEVSNEIALESLKKKYDSLSEKYTALKETSTTLKDENTVLSKNLSEAEAQLSNTSKSYEALKSESADFIKLKSDYERTSAKLASQAETLEACEVELGRLQMNQNLWLFFGGAGILLVGIIIGMSARRQKRRSLI
ncbi:MAG: TIGR04211 family SH3 domain-containing protein [Desulfobacterales bacterium]|nr:TIGR04211 family SH3 domain-containing protein [Desulfobacterales bacterium]